MRLIDADALCIPPEEINAKMTVACAPTIDAVPVRHGTWEEVRYDEPDGYFILYRCPFCGCERPRQDNWCKDCGAKMDGGA